MSYCPRCLAPLTTDGANWRCAGCAFICTDDAQAQQHLLTARERDYLRYLRRRASQGAFDGPDDTTVAPEGALPHA